MINIVIPVGGKASRFYAAGYTEYKPFLPFNGRTVIERVMEDFKGLDGQEDYRFIFCVRPEDVDRFKTIARPWDIIVPDVVQKGAAYGVLAAKAYIFNDDPLIITNSDDLFEWDIMGFLTEVNDWYGGILTFETPPDSKWSYAITNCQLTDGGHVVSLVEYVIEKPVHPKGEATAGCYYWRYGKDFVVAAERMIEDGFRVNGEFYVAPVYNWMPRNRGIVTYMLPEGAMTSVGTPEDYESALAAEEASCG